MRVKNMRRVVGLCVDPPQAAGGGAQVGAGWEGGEGQAEGEGGQRQAERGRERERHPHTETQVVGRWRDREMERDRNTRVYETHIVRDRNTP